MQPTEEAVPPTARRAASLLRGADERRDDLGRHPLRRQILDFVTKRPGANITDLCRSIGAGWGTMQHHLYLLGRAGLIRSVVQGRNHRIFHVGEGNQRTSRVALLLRGRVWPMVQTVLQEPGIGQRQLTGKIGMSRKVLRDYVGLLTEAGLIIEVPRSKFRHYYPTPALVELASDPQLQHMHVSIGEPAQAGVVPS